MLHADTIVALSSSVASALRAIVRMSGGRAFELVELMSEGSPEALEHAQVADRRIRPLEGVVFAAQVYPFRSPRSSTGEDAIELHMPASPFLVQAVLRRLAELGARAAEPGEFTARAYFHGKLDLTRAEGVAATIAASNRAELDAARRLLGGELARRLAPILDTLVQTLALIEVGIDFVEEDVTFISDAEVGRNLASAEKSLRRLIDESPRIERLNHEPRIVLIGRPNAGKSTLLNALAGTARAVVSEVAGTTRDVLSARIALPRGFVTLVDVAGIDSADNPLSSQMQKAAVNAIDTADAIVLLIESTDPRPPITLAREPNLLVFSKRDLGAGPPDALAIDAPGREGLEELRARLDEIAFGVPGGGSAQLSINARHSAAIGDALDSLKRAQGTLSQGAELLSAEIRLAIDQIGSIIGSVSPDDVLGRIFSGFCIGK